jgi:hypothetical protein
MEPEIKKHSNISTCFKCGAPSIDSIVHLGPIAMDSKNLDEEMKKESLFGAKLRKIAEKVEAL